MQPAQLKAPLFCRYSPPQYQQGGLGFETREKGECYQPTLQLGPKGVFYRTLSPSMPEVAFCTLEYFNISGMTPDMFIR